MEATKRKFSHLVPFVNAVAEQRRLRWLARQEALRGPLYVALPPTLEDDREAA